VDGGAEVFHISIDQTKLELLTRRLQIQVPEDLEVPIIVVLGVGLHEHDEGLLERIHEIHLLLQHNGDLLCPRVDAAQVDFGADDLVQGLEVGCWVELTDDCHHVEVGDWFGQALPELHELNRVDHEIHKGDLNGYIPLILGKYLRLPVRLVSYGDAYVEGDEPH
jgi:hypothetical protein